MEDFFNFEHVLRLNDKVKTLSASSVKINFQISDFDT